MLVCGETEDEMKAHFGYRIVGIDSNFKCNMTLLLDTTVHKYDNPKASELIAIYGNDTLSSKTLYINGEFIIDADFALNNCHLYFTKHSLIDLDATKDFAVFNGTILEGACDYWDGMEASGAGSKVTIDSSIVKEMDHGIKIKDNAVIIARKNTFLNNVNGSIHFIKINDSLYSGLVQNNTIATDTAFVSSNGSSKCYTGISVYNSDYITIGSSSDVSKGNTFTNLHNGIYVYSTANISTTLPSNTNHLRICNNKFENILPTLLNNNKQMLSEVYSSIIGAGVYIDYTLTPSFNANTTVSYTSAGISTNALFNNCTKAIVSQNNRLIDTSLYIKDCTFGIMNAIADGRPYLIRNNKIEHAVLGIQCLGDNTGSLVNSNIITCDDGLAVSVDSIYWPKGIDIRRNIFAASNDVSIKYNIIEINSYAGHGIHFISSGSANIYDNQISLTYADTATMTMSLATMLEGIHVSFGKGTSITKNEILGNNNMASMGRENIAGISANNSWDLQIGCNLVSKTRFGVQAISNCQTDSTAVKGNIMHQQLLGWAFRHLGTEGTFGDVGDTVNDNHNTFPNTGLFKVFKFCDSSQAYKIFTHPNTLDLTESSSYNIITQLNDCKYDVSDNSGADIYECPVIYNFQQTNSSNFGQAEAIQIATNTKSYSEYPEIAHWMDAMKLYEQLKADTSFRNSNDTLLNFYDSLDTEIISQINSTNDRLATLIASMQSQNYELYLQRMDEAANNNSNIVSESEQEANEHDINEIYLKLLQYGKDTLTAQDSIFIETLANQCPYIGGTAVYKARMLYALYNPASMFDDISLCNSIGVYKNGGGSGLFDDENNYLKSLKPKQNDLVNSENQFILYPNPASTTVTIGYKLQPSEKGDVIVYDLLGRAQMKIDLDYNINKVSVNILSLPQGIYTYKYFVNNVQKEAGKLLIE
jgi:hypothetical protein